jgi:hypothetical protein
MQSPLGYEVDFHLNQFFNAGNKSGWSGKNATFRFGTA